MEFPRSEAEIKELAMAVAQGFEEGEDRFPSPPVSAAELRAKLEHVHGVTAAALGSEATARAQRAARDEAVTDLAESLQLDLKYAEFAVREDPEWLKRLGWNTRRSPSPLQAPGEVRNITIDAEGEDWLVLKWKAPAEGGAPGVYRIQRRRDAGPWEDIGISMDTEEVCGNQPRGVALEYRVFAVNKAGTGQPSATVSVTF